MSIVGLDSGLGADRKQLPQIPEDAVPDFLQYLEDEGVPFTRNKERVSELKPTQKHLNAEKIQKMSRDDNLSTSPFIISQENRILDGHHRWATHKIKDPNMVVDVIKVDLPIDELVEIGHDFDLSFTKGVTEVIKLQPLIPRNLNETKE